MNIPNTLVFFIKITNPDGIRIVTNKKSLLFQGGFFCHYCYFPINLSTSVQLTTFQKALTYATRLFWYFR